MKHMLDKNSLLYSFLLEMNKQGASDLLISANFAPALKIDGELIKLGKNNLNAEQAEHIVYSSFNENQKANFSNTNEANFSVMVENLGRFRISAFMQRGFAAMVVRSTKNIVPSLSELNLPPILGDLSLAKRGIILVTGATGSGKTTTIASIIDYYNQKSCGHVITLEDPIEFVHNSKNCIINQREIGIDSYSWENALKNSLRQAPDLIAIGEIRDKQTMEYALQYSETGHLCIATLHANNANQAIERILNFFPQDSHKHLLFDIASNLRAIICQRLIKKNTNGRVPVVEVMLGSPLIKDLIMKNELSSLKEAIKKSQNMGMICFDDALFNLYEQDLISYNQAIVNADSENDLRLQIKLNSKKKNPEVAMEQKWEII